MREKKPSTRIWKLEEEARGKGGSSEKLTKIKKKRRNISWIRNIQWALERVPGHVTGLPQEEKGK